MDLAFTALFGDRVGTQRLGMVGPRTVDARAGHADDVDLLALELRLTDQPGQGAQVAALDDNRHLPFGQRVTLGLGEEQRQVVLAARRKNELRCGFRADSHLRHGAAGTPAGPVTDHRHHLPGLQQADRLGPDRRRRRRIASRVD